jgi:SAM-dependent methyltransferase
MSNVLSVSESRPVHVSSGIPLIQRATSITHEHLLSVIATELSKKSTGTIRILDAGCGAGVLIEYLQKSLPSIFPNHNVELYGFDVDDSGVQHGGFFDSARRRLSAILPESPWDERLHLIGTRDNWPFPDASFDFIVSNQVLEHVANPTHFLAEVYRCLANNGCSVHLFPLKNVMLEGHLLLPFVHRIQNHDLRFAAIRLLSRIGMGRFPSWKRNGTELSEFSERHADYLHYFTWYLTYRDWLHRAKNAGLRASFRYTREFYTAKLRSILRMTPRWSYEGKRSALREWWSVRWLSYVSCVTLFLEKRETYRSGV